MMHKRIFVVGYFGYVTNQLDGQTVKTRNIFSLLEAKKSELDSIRYYDTQLLRTNLFSVFTMFGWIIKCDKLIIIPAHNSLLTIFPIAYILSKICRFDIIQIAVGGWLESFYVKHSIVCAMTKRIRTLLVQNESVRSGLEKQFGFTNVEIIPNYRIHSYIPTMDTSKDVFKIVFMSRINKMKGLDVVFDIAEYFTKNGRNNIIIDFYGSILDDDKVYFHNNLAKYDSVKYYGELLPENINSTLNNYDMLILPTRYYTEGFPGAILDAYISGIPVLVSNWKHAHEFVENGLNGFICDVDDVSQFVAIIDKLCNDSNLLIQMKHNAYESSEQYSDEKAWEILKPYLI